MCTPTRHTLRTFIPIAYENLRALLLEGDHDIVRYADRLTIPHAPERLDRLTSFAESEGWAVIVRPVADPSMPEALAMVHHNTREIYLKSDSSPDTRLYLLLHEIGHTAHGAGFGIPDPLIPAYSSWAETVAELNATLVLLAWCKDPNWGYFLNKQADPLTLNQAFPVAAPLADRLITLLSIEEK
jgi:hypothetical protein